MANCPTCGKRVKADDRFCNQCGHGLGKEASPVNVFYNSKYTYFTGTSTPIDLRVGNRSDSEIKDLEISVTCPQLGLSQWFAVPPLPEAEEEELEFEFRFPEVQKGIYKLQFMVSYKSGDTFVNFGGSLRVQICEDVLNALKLKTNFAGSRIIGSYIDINLKEAISGGAITSADQLLAEQREAKDRWREVALKAAKTPFFLKEKPDKRKQHSLMLVNTQEPGHRYYLFAKDRLVFGRPHDEPVDVCTIVYPYDEKDKNSLTHHVSRKQFALEVRGAELKLKNLCSPRALGTVLAGKRMGAGETAVIHDDTQINLSMVLGLDLKLHFTKRLDRYVVADSDWESIPGVIHAGEDQSELSKISEKKRLACVSISRRLLQPGRDRSDEHYLLVTRLATIGNEKQCSICLCREGVVEHHARIYQYGGRFYLNVLPDGLGAANVDGRAPERNEIIPLKPEMRITFGESQWEIREVAWDYCLPGEGGESSKP
jgi:hypothetical protein